MEISVRSSSISSSFPSIPRCNRSFARIQIKGGDFAGKFSTFLANPSVLRFNSSRIMVKSSSMHDVRKCKSSLESLFCYDKAIPEEVIEKPVGLSLNRKEIGSSSACTSCEVKGAILCATCSGSGLYVDSILESQGIILKVRCLGCGGTGNIMCSKCGGRGHL